MLLFFFNDFFFFAFIPTAPGLFSSADMLDFGTLRTMGEYMIFIETSVTKT